MKILTILTFLPLIGALALYLIPQRKDDEGGNAAAFRLVALGTTLGAFVLSVKMLVNFDATITGYQFIERSSWIKDFGVELSLIHI